MKAHSLLLMKRVTNFNLSRYMLVVQKEKLFYNVKPDVRTNFNELLLSPKRCFFNSVNCMVKDQS